MAVSLKDNRAGNKAFDVKRIHPLTKKIDARKADADSARSEMGNVYQEAESYGFHRRALKEAIKLKNMEPDARNDYLSNLKLYCDELQIWDQGELFGDAPRTPQPPVGSGGDAPNAERQAEVQAGTARSHFSVGHQAGLAGESADKNPWPDGTPAFTSFLEGWLAGQKELVEQQHARPSRRSKLDDAAQTSH